MKIVECPLCESKFDISRASEGTRLKCGSCKKIFGVVQGGEMVPVFDETPAKTVPAKPTGIGVKPRMPLRRPAAPPAIRHPMAVQPGPEEYEIDLPDEAMTDVRLPGKTRMPPGRFRRDPSLSEIVRAVEKREKPEALLVLAGLAGLAAIGMLIWVAITITAPMDESMFQVKPEKTKEKKATKIEKSESKDEGKAEEKSKTETPKEKTE
ncbi:MAG: hypothetical protein AAB019_09625 [Planctomycetota bacterium]